MIAIARAALASIALITAGGLAQAQTGPAEPQVILRASTARMSVGNRKLSGHVIADVRVGTDGRVLDVAITENATEEGLEPQILKVLRSARFVPALDADGRPIEATTAVKLELRQSTGDSPKPMAANTDPEATEKEKARISRMRCADFRWEWDLIKDASGDPDMEFMPRIATLMYAAMRTEAGDYVDVKVWKEAPKALKKAAEQCGDNPNAAFWEGVYRPLMDEAVPK